MRAKDPRTRIRRSMVKELDEKTRLEVFERDGSCCIWCHDPQKGVQWSHVIPRQHLSTRWELDNGMTLCAGCHLRWHDYPTLSGDWFRKNYPERAERIHRLYLAGGRVNVKAVYEEALKGAA